MIAEPTRPPATAELFCHDAAPRAGDTPAPGRTAGLPDLVPWADRRLGDREAPRPTSRAEVVRTGAWSGPDFAEELLDVSAGGIRVRVARPVRPGERFDVTLWGPGAVPCGRARGTVRWSGRAAGGALYAGLQLTRPLPAGVIRHLVGAPATRLADVWPGLPAGDLVPEPV